MVYGSLSRSRSGQTSTRVMCMPAPVVLSADGSDTSPERQRRDGAKNPVAGAPGLCHSDPALVVLGFGCVISDTTTSTTNPSGMVTRPGWLNGTSAFCGGSP